MKNVPTERWKRIDSILDGALDLPQEEREAYLDRECGDDHDLRTKVQAMLGAGQEAGNFLAEGPEGLADMQKAVRRAAEEEEDTLAGSHVGPYRLIRAIGRGGMGQVYLAMRDDQSYTRYVAVKVIRRGMDTDEILHRFRMERRILASLAHPNIARLLDGGATEDGLSYFVMEYIEGEPIHEYCDARSMPVKQRLALFREVCSAVQFAHQNLIVHRDLKPSNILVTADGRPKLLDFGIAKVLNPNLTGYTVPMTIADMRVMTPEYASPEQMRGGTVTTASDVYQLGILLYELLTGARPHRMEGRTRKEIEKLVLSAEPERPSTAISQVSRELVSKRTQAPEKGRNAIEHLRKTLSGDLDRIVLMALRKEPDRRYASVDLLQEDIKRYLEGMPVSAQADTMAYRTSKFVRRHKLGVAASGIVATLLIVITILAVRFALVTSEQRDRLAEAAQQNEEVSRFLAGIFGAANPEVAQGRVMTPEDLLDEGMRRVDEQLATQPALQAQMLLEMGVAYRELGDYETSRTLLERSLAMRRADPGTLPHDEASSLYELGLFHLLDDDLERSTSLISEAVTLQRSVGGEDDLVAAVWAIDHGAGLAYSSRLEESSAILERSVALLSEAHGDMHPKVIEANANQTWIYHDLGRLEEAEAMYRSLDQKLSETIGANHPNALTNLANLGMLLLDTGELDEAERIHRDVYARRVQVLGERHPQAAGSLNMLGRVLQQQGDQAQAEALFRETILLHREGLGETHRVLGRDHFTLAGLLLEKGDLEGAEDELIAALQIYRVAFEGNPDHPWTQSARDMLREVYNGQGTPDRPILF